MVSIVVAGVVVQARNNEKAFVIHARMRAHRESKGAKI